MHFGCLGHGIQWADLKKVALLRPKVLGDYNAGFMMHFNWWYSSRKVIFSHIRLAITISNMVSIHYPSLTSIFLFCILSVMHFWCHQMLRSQHDGSCNNKKFKLILSNALKVHYQKSIENYAKFLIKILLVWHLSTIIENQNFPTVIIALISLFLSQMHLKILK